MLSFFCSPAFLSCLGVYKYAPYNRWSVWAGQVADLRRNMQSGASNNHFAIVGNFGCNNGEFYLQLRPILFCNKHPVDNMDTTSEIESSRIKSGL